MRTRNRTINTMISLFGQRKRLAACCLFFAASLCLSLLMLLAAAVQPLSAGALRGAYADSRRVYARDGTLLREAVNLEGARANWVEREDISEFVIKAAIAAEDKRFYTHPGFDIIALARALLQNAGSGREVSGASTLTMQLARLLFGHEHGITGKLMQIWDALRLELFLDKETILVNYLNRLPYGGGAVGIEAASLRYFNKPNLHLSLAEAAFLAGLPQSPTELDPYKYFTAAKKRQEYVLGRMYETGLIDGKAYELALHENIRLESAPVNLRAMHFTDYVLSLNPAPGDIHTTLDIGLNNQIERIIKDHVASLQNQGLTNAAALVLDNTDGSILAMVGSADYWQALDGMVNGVLAPRQPGSTLKPFTYALALERGFTPATVIADVETEYQDTNDKLYIPKNYSGMFHGPVLLREALGRSLNIPAVKLANAVGLDALLERLRIIGFNLPKSMEYYGLGLTLGSGEVSLLELAQGYAMFARRGLLCRAAACRNRTLDRDHPETMVRVFPPEISFLITDILADEDLRIQAFGLNNPLLLGFPMAVKTGTSQDWRDNWVIGYTDKYTVAVWAGNFEGFPMNQMSGSVGAGPLFNKIATLVVTRGSNPEPPGLPLPPEGVEKIIVCKESGMRPTEYCEHTQAIYVLREGAPRPFCNVHRKVRIDIRNGLLASDKCPAGFVEERVFTYLPPVYSQWQEAQGITPPPIEFSPLSPRQGITADSLVIVKPRNHDIYIIEPGYDLATQTLQLSGEVDPPVPQVTWLIDGERVARVNWPYTADWPLRKGRHSVMMMYGGRKSDPVYFEVR